MRSRSMLAAGLAEQDVMVAGRLRNERVKNGNLVLDGACAADRAFVAKRKP